MDFFLAKKILKQKLSWQKWMGLLALSLHLCNILLHRMMQSLSISTEARTKIFVVFSDGQTCFSQTLQLTLHVCCYYYVHSLRKKTQRIY